MASTAFERHICQGETERLLDFPKKKKIKKTPNFTIEPPMTHHHRQQQQMYNGHLIAWPFPAFCSSCSHFLAFFPLDDSTSSWLQFNFASIQFASIRFDLIFFFDRVFLLHCLVAMIYNIYIFWATIVLALKAGGMYNWWPDFGPRSFAVADAIHHTQSEMNWN